MKGIVFQVEGGKAVILKNNGGFSQVPAQPHWQVGDVVAASKTSPRLRPLAAMAAGLVLVASLATAGHRLYFSPVSLVSVDVNPSTELTVNRFDRVIAVNARNGEGQAILENANIQNRRSAEALETLLQTDLLGQYLSDGSYLVLTVQSADGQKQQALLQSLQSTADRAIAHHGRVNAEYYPVDSGTVASAHSLDVTAGKYLLLQELEEAAPSVDIQEYRHCSVSELREEIDAHCRQAQNGGMGQGRGHHGGKR